ncbi:hypothetical protein GCM10009710_17470 [Aeromicrobium alkaliterrae]|uniref:Transposase n=1 Tax=Aeromicrobium alkaliterrae TaxID=302168 RepID=A0ABP4VWQ5_9ACTN
MEKSVSQYLTTILIAGLEEMHSAAWGKRNRECLPELLGAVLKARDWEERMAKSEDEWAFFALNCISQDIEKVGAVSA